jgi:hypothetical protein
MLDTIVQKDGLIRLDGLHRLDYIGNKQAGKDIFLTAGRRGGVLHRRLHVRAFDNSKSGANRRNRGLYARHISQVLR